LLFFFVGMICSKKPKAPSFQKSNRV